MKTKIFIFLLSCVTAYHSQVNNYSFTQTLSTYGAANSGSLVGLTFQDDDVNPVNLPFPFTFNGNTYTTINVCSNGYLSFGSLTGFEYTALSDLGTQEVIAPFSQDIFMASVILGDLTSGSNTITNCSSVAGFSVGDVILDWSGDFGSVNPTVTAVSGNSIVVNVNATGNYASWDAINSNGYIKQSVSGTTPNQICEFEFRNFTRFAVYDEVINFKVRLYENGNKIEFLYGTMIPGTDFTPSEVGLKGLSNSDFKSRTVSSSNTWSNSIASTLISDACDFNAGKFPLSGQLYIWAPVTCTPPAVSIVSSATALCEGSSATLTANGASSYTWSNGSNASVTVVSPASNTIVTLSAGSATCPGSASVSLQVNPNPTISVAGSQSLICLGASASFTASGATTYTWSTGVTGSMVSLSPTANAVYIVSGTSGDCSASTSFSLNVVPCTGIEEAAAGKLTLHVSPNPFNHYLRVYSNDNKGGTLRLSDALGKVVYEQNIEDLEQVQINTTALEKGMYILELRKGKESSYKKLIKE